MKFFSVILFPLLLLLMSCGYPEEDLQELFDDHYEYRLQADPLFATDQGVHKFNDKLPDTSLDALEERYNQNKNFLDRLESISYQRLSREDQINYDIFKLQLENDITNYELNGHLLPLNGWWDYHATFADLSNRVPLNNRKDYENYLKRLEAFPSYNDGFIERMEKGSEENWVRPKVVFDNYVESVESHITDDPSESVLFEPFTNFPVSVEPEEQELLISRAEEVIRNVIVPEYERLRDFLTETYIPNGSESIGITDLEGGSEYYDFLISRYTTLDLAPEEVHQEGLREVKRIREEMMKIVEEEDFEDDFDTFVEFLRSNPRFYANSPEELLKETALVLKKMDGKLPELFKTLPRLPYGIREVPSYLAPRTTTAYYSRGAADGTRAGYYAVNTHNLNSRPLYEIEALSFHEAVPGHHLQIALQQELQNLPVFRTASGFTAFTEGWALYSERLGLEVGFYEDPYSNFGRLSYEMWRALRLVVDTGIHSMGWERQQSIDYMAQNSALSLHNIRSEVDRYIFWPGQALAYKMGEIKIRELRDLTELELKEEFDIREFHDVVLLSGSVPLYVLEENVNRYIDEKAESSGQNR
ncbi:MAG TPA: DUF885 domain-containing protein [Balneolaceae bacterium]|nr:DUF885 domain-containing protein [Balneolaceae bacterium]